MSPWAWGQGQLRHSHPTRWPCGFGVLGAADRVSAGAKCRGHMRRRAHPQTPVQHGVPRVPLAPCARGVPGYPASSVGWLELVTAIWHQGFCPLLASANRLLASAGSATQSALLAWPPSPPPPPPHPHPGHRASRHAAQPSLALALPAGIFPWGGEREGGGVTSSPAPLLQGALHPSVRTGAGEVPRSSGMSPNPLARPQSHWDWPRAPTPPHPTPSPLPRASPHSAPPRLTPPPELGLGPVPPSHQCWGIH